MGQDGRAWQCPIPSHGGRLVPGGGLGTTTVGMVMVQYCMVDYYNLGIRLGGRTTTLPGRTSAFDPMCIASFATP